MTLGLLSLTPGTALIGVVLAAIIVMGLFRFLLRLAWRLVGIVLTLVIIGGAILFFLNALHIQW